MKVTCHSPSKEGVVRLSRWRGPSPFRSSEAGSREVKRLAKVLSAPQMEVVKVERLFTPSEPKPPTEWLRKISFLIHTQPSGKEFLVDLARVCDLLRTHLSISRGFAKSLVKKFMRSEGVPPHTATLWVTAKDGKVLHKLAIVFLLRNVGPSHRGTGKKREEIWKKEPSGKAMLRGPANQSSSPILEIVIEPANWGFMGMGRTVRGSWNKEIQDGKKKISEHPRIMALAKRLEETLRQLMQPPLEIVAL